MAIRSVDRYTEEGSVICNDGNAMPRGVVRLRVSAVNGWHEKKIWVRGQGSVIDIKRTFAPLSFPSIRSLKTVS